MRRTPLVRLGGEQEKSGNGKMPSALLKLVDGHCKDWTDF
jgi:hypothetical protein